MKHLILTDLTRFSKPDKVCVALVDPASGECYRPLPYLSSKACEDLDIQPGAKILGDFVFKSDRKCPHIEDASYTKIKFAGASTAEEFKKVLEKTLFPSVSEGFGVQIDENQKHIPDGAPAQRSILTIKVEPHRINIHEDRYKPGKIKLSFCDLSGHRYRYLSITDRGFYDFAKKHQHDSELPKLQTFISEQDEIFLRIGLSRSFEASDGRKGCWLQVNGLYSFPDYPKEIRQYT